MKLRNTCLCSVDFSVSMVKSRCLWKQEDATSKDRGPNIADARRGSPGRGTEDLFVAKVDEVCNEGIYVNGRLITPVNYFSNTLRASLCLIHRYDN
jgi:hypothetical protein